MFLKSAWSFRRNKKQKQLNETQADYSLAKVYTPIDQLELGMYVSELDRPWLESPFLFQGFEIKTPGNYSAQQ